MEFGRLVAELSPGAQWLDLEIGPFCMHRESRVADSGRKEVEVPGAQATFRDEIAHAGLKSDVAGDGLFEPSAGAQPADFVASGVITYLHETLCAHHPGYSSEESGEIYMTVEWRLYSKSRKEVVAKTEVTVDRAVGDQLDAGKALVANAFVEAVHRFATDPKMRRALAAQPAAAQEAMLPTAQPPIALAGSLAAQPHGVNVAADSVVLISLPDGSFGSGFLVSKDGYLLTDQHVVGDAKTVKVRWSDGVVTEGVVVRIAKGRDVALVKTDPRGHAPLPLRKDPPVRGDTVYAIGAPLQEAFQGTVTRGVISAHRVVDGCDLLQGDVNINHGMSGGPVLDDGGRVVALSESVIQKEKYVPEGINFFTPVGDALRYLSLTPQ